jgi:hypothetical protein
VRIVESADCRTHLQSIMGAVRKALDDLPEETRLSVWFQTCLHFSEEETADLLSVPANAAKASLAEGIGQMVDAMAGTGVMTDPVSILTALRVLPVERAPASLTRKIAAITAGHLERRGVGMGSCRVVGRLCGPQLRRHVNRH